MQHPLSSEQSQRQHPSFQMPFQVIMCIGFIDCISYTLFLTFFLIDFWLSYCSEILQIHQNVCKDYVV